MFLKEMVKKKRTGRAEAHVEKSKRKKQKKSISEHKNRLKSMSPISDILLSRTRDADPRTPSGMGESLEF